MIIFPIIIVVALFLFVYFKVAQSRGKGPGDSQLNNAKANISLGVFILAFGINSYVTLQTTTAAIIALIFAALGIANLYFGLQRYKHYKPIAAKEKKSAK
ncbi:YtpI family protein [Alkalicoccus daliensis]|uniref:YtpI-like protein n=1 Tax=Alkalicoccus daliensis TaxID=745820 RepID=A0A1H0CC43_9BACI|nr:YtpI family protein [Alkalicoccus daliensis]SDN55457.1 YtpI-like protein [Alkalicoccus daliensis]